jgi:hypothetical protein
MAFQYSNKQLIEPDQAKQAQLEINLRLVIQLPLSSATGMITGL